MAIQNFFTSRDNNLDGNTYVGQLGRLWYNPDTNSVYASDGVTVGGIPVDLATNTNILANNIVANDIAINTITSRTNIIPVDGSLSVTGNVTFTGNISPATETKIGGVRAGPGANISNDGTLTIDTSGLPFSFGDFTANLNILTLVNEDQNMILATNGSAEVQLVGNIGFYKTDGFPPNIANRYASFTDDGQIQIIVTATDGAGAVQIIGSESANVIEPGIGGTLLHVTGQLDIPCRLYYDGNSDYVSLVARRWNGNVDVPTPVLAGQDVLRINATAATDAGVGNVAMAQIQFRALENQTTTAQGSTLNFVVTPVGQSAANRVEVANVTVANGVTATQFTTAGNVSAGNVIASLLSSTTVAATGNVAGGNITTLGQVTAVGNITGTYLFGNAAFTTGINAYGNVFANGVSVLATTGSSSLTITPGNNAVITGDNGLKSVTIGISQSPSFTGNVTAGNVTSNAAVTGVTVTASGNLVGNNAVITNDVSAATASISGNVTAGNVAATNYTGLVTHSVREAGDVSGSTVTLNMTTDDIVRCSFANQDMTVAFSNIIPGRIVTLLAQKTDGGTDTINTGVTTQNISTGDATVDVDGLSTAVLTYYSLGTTTGNIYCSINFRP